VHRFIAIAGNMGVGKTSMVEFLQRTYGFEPVYEPYTTNPYLDDFYRDMKSWAFHSQLYFLTHKFRLHRGMDIRHGTVVQDRSIYEDAEIFCKNLYNGRFISARDYRTYTELYEVMQAALQPPDLLIYLRCSVRAIRRRIRIRGRPSELAIPLGYLQKLNRLYESWVGRYTLSPVLVWDSEKMDYVTDLVHQLEFRQALETFL
jgi:deoxyadenosine/deoxycytidine kinase